MREVQSPPTAAALMESTRSIGYSFDSAVADIVDNSISANAMHVWIRTLPDDDPYLSILDDGDGMDSQELCEAMRYGVNPNLVRDPNDLGRFGLGMKMASLSQCRRLTVVSKTKDSLSACRWDLDRVIETDEWTLQILSEEDIVDVPMYDDLKDLDHGTLVVWQDLDKLKERSIDMQDLMTETIASCRSHLSLVFHRFLDSTYGGRLEMFMNGSEIMPLDPFLSRNTKVARLPEQTMEIQGQTVVIRPFVLPPESTLSKRDVELMGGMKRNLQGFWVYRNKRLIIPGTWFRLTGSKELTKLARVMIDIPNTLDSIWDIDVKKSSAIVPAPFRRDFESILDQILTKSERKYTYRGRKANDDSKTFFWDKIEKNGSLSYQVNLSHPLIRQGMDQLDEESRAWFERIIALLGRSLPLEDIFASLAGRSEWHLGETREETDQIIGMGIGLLEMGLKLEDLIMMEPFIGNKKALDALRRYERGV